MFLLRASVSTWWLLWEWAECVHFVHAVHGALEEGLGVVDGAYSSGQRRWGGTEALVHPGPITHTVQLTLHLSGQVAACTVVQALHAVRHLCFSVWTAGVLTRRESEAELLNTCWRDDYKEWMTSALLREELLLLCWAFCSLEIDTEFKHVEVIKWCSELTQH